MNKLNKVETAIASCLGLLLAIGIGFGFTYGATLLAQYVVSGMFKYALPFWPTFAGWVLLGIIGKSLLGGK